MRTATAFVMNWRSLDVRTQQRPTTHHLPRTTTARVSLKLEDVRCHLPATSIRLQTSTCQDLVTSLACLACLQATATVPTSWLATTVQMSHVSTSMEKATCALWWVAPMQTRATSTQTPKSAASASSIRAKCLDAPTPTPATTMRMRIQRTAHATTPPVWAARTAMPPTSTQRQRWTMASARLMCLDARS